MEAALQRFYCRAPSPPRHSNSPSPVLLLLSGDFSTAVCPVSLVFWRAGDVADHLASHTNAQTHTQGLFSFLSARVPDGEHTSSARQTHMQMDLWLDWRKMFRVLFVAKWLHVRRFGSTTHCQSVMIDDCCIPHTLNTAVGFHCIVITCLVLRSGALAVACIPLQSVEPAEKTTIQ